MLEPSIPCTPFFYLPMVNLMYQTPYYCNRFLSKNYGPTELGNLTCFLSR